jgi:AcrR family transcriptional regulator
VSSERKQPTRRSDAAKRQTNRLRTRQKEFTQQVLVDAALEVFTDVGYASATIEDIARVAGTSRPTFYQYFNSKADVALSLLDLLRQRFDQVFEPLFGLSSPTEADLRSWVERAVATWYPLSAEASVIEQAMAVEPTVSGIGSGITVANIDAVADFLRSHNDGLSRQDARVHACHLVAEFDMLPYLRLFGIPGDAAHVVETLAASWWRVLRPTRNNGERVKAAGPRRSARGQ